MEKSKRRRADLELCERGLAPSREKARALIMAGVVYRNQVKIDKPSDMVSSEDALTVRGAPHPYVSRGGLKLERALERFAVSPEGRVCLDVGASTGGFTDVLLRAGASHVYAVDVGTNQLDWKIRSDGRVTAMERTNARYMEPDMFPLTPELAVMDVSFISITLLIPAISRVMNGGGRIIALIKPQFEAGRELVGKRGVVSDPAVHANVIKSIVDFAPGAGWKVDAIDYSPITGPEGNIEFFADLTPGEGAGVSEADIRELVGEAHARLPAGRA